MARSGNLKKYLLIIKLFQESRQKAFSMRVIQSHLESHGFRNTSSRTLSRDFQALNWEFGIHIQYDERKRGYFLHTANDEDLSDFNQFLKLLELAERVQSIGQTLQSASASSRSIVFEHNDLFKGSEHLKPLIDAIERRIRVRFYYHPYYKPTSGSYTVRPYLVMEHRNRWYLLGQDEKAEKIKTFGLDRITHPELLQPFSDAPHFDYKSLLEHTYGITYLEEPPQEVILAFTPHQGKYIKSLPLHHSQKILLDNEHELRISMRVVLNYDLKMQLLSYGSQVDILEPAGLRMEIADELKKALKNYCGRTVFG